MEHSNFSSVARSFGYFQIREISSVSRNAALTRLLTGKDFVDYHPNF